jgi:hypothetical protein
MRILITRPVSVSGSPIIFLLKTLMAGQRVLVCMPVSETVSEAIPVAAIHLSVYGYYSHLKILKEKQT